MTHYVLPKHHASGVSRGRIRAVLARVSNKRHARIGEPVALDAATAQTQRKRLGVPRCVARARLVIGPDGVRRVLDRAVDASAAGEAVGLILGAVEQGCPADPREAALKGLLKLTGHRTLTALRQAVTGREDPPDVVEAELVAWGALR